MPNMHDTYTHSKGWTIKRNDSGLTLDRPDGVLSYFFPFGNSYDALRDFFLNELGLWRDEETGMLVLTSTWDKTDAGSAAMIYDGRATRWGYPDETNPGRYDKAVARWRDTITTPPREPKPGEVWRITLEDGSETNAVAGYGRYDVSCIPTDRRRLIVEADGTVCSNE